MTKKSLTFELNNIKNSSSNLQKSIDVKKNKTKIQTQYVFDTTTRKQTQLT
jgi:hypothetical protein